MPRTVGSRKLKVERGTGGSDDGETVVVLLAVDGAYEADKRVGGTGIGLGGHRLGVFYAGIVQRQVHPFVSTVQNEAVGVGGLQVWIATLVGVAIDIYR